MSRRLLAACPILVVTMAIPAHSQHVPGTNGGPAASVSGRVCYGYDYLLRNVPVYLFTWKQSEPIRRRVEALKGIIYSAGSKEADKATASAHFDNEVDVLVKQLPKTSRTQADRRGGFRFSGVAPGVRYLVVTEFVREDGLSFGARSTPVLSQGKELSVDVTILTMPWLIAEGDCSRATTH